MFRLRSALTCTPVALCLVFQGRYHPRKRALETHPQRVFSTLNTYFFMLFLDLLFVQHVLINICKHGQNQCWSESGLVSPSPQGQSPSPSTSPSGQRPNPPSVSPSPLDQSPSPSPSPLNQSPSPSPNSVGQSPSPSPRVQQKSE